jgi:putative nucleotidyltransferase with HDIG domain
LAFSLHVFKHRETLHYPEIPVDALWHHSLETARIAQNLCRIKLSEEASNRAFFAGLVHDLGRLILIEHQPENYRQVCQVARDLGSPLYVAEQEVFGVTHSELSAFMLRLWGLDPTIVEAVSKCESVPQNPDFSVASAVYLANLWSRQANPPDQFLTGEVDPKLLEAFGLLDFKPNQNFRGLPTSR